MANAALIIMSGSSTFRADVLENYQIAIPIRYSDVPFIF